MRAIVFATLIYCFTSYGFAADSSLELPRSTPEQQGIPSAAILDFVETADREITVMNSFMLVRHGHVVAEGWWAPYDASTPHQLYSLSKSFTSTAAGLAIAEGEFDLDDSVLSFFPNDAPAQPSENLLVMCLARYRWPRSRGSDCRLACGTRGCWRCGGRLRWC